VSGTPLQPALLPRYVTRFTCTQERCADTCCSGWKVNVDREAWERFHALPPSPVREQLLKAVQPEPAPTGDQDFAWIRPTAGTLCCPMLQGGLCTVHKKLGPEGLANSCFSYPRFTRAVGDELSQGMSLSCPEAARLALLAPDAFEFQEAELSVRQGMVTHVALPEGLSQEDASAVRVFCLQLVRSRQVEPWVRLAVLGLFCEQLDERIRRGGAQEVPALLEQFQSQLAVPGLLAALEATEPHHAEQAAVFAPLLRTGLGTPPSPVQARVLSAVAEGLGVDPQTGTVDPAMLRTHYERGVSRLPEALAASAPLLLEHYLLNELFREAFPFDRASPFAHYLDLALRFGVLRLMLAARCTGEVLPDAAALVETVHVFCRRYQHDPQFVREARAAFHAGGWDVMPRLFPFLRA